MKLKSVLVFSVVIVSLTFVAIAGDVKELDLKFKGEGQFVVEVVDFTEPWYTLSFKPPGGSELLNVTHLGLSEVTWELLVEATNPFDPATFVFDEGTFTISGANGSDSLEGHYSYFYIDPLTGDYDLDWAFTGGTGRFEGAVGTGHTDGLANLATGDAKFEFSGEVTIPKED